MPGMQFMGTMPKAEYPMAKVLKTGMAGYGMGQQLQEKKAAGAREERKLGLAEKKLDTDLSTIAYEKKRDVATMVIDVAKTLDASAADEFVNDPKVKALFADINWPLPTGLKREVDIKDAAIDAISKGESLPGMSEDETKKAAGVLVSELKITPSDVKMMESAIEVPWYERLWPGAQTEAGKKRLKVREQHKKQFEGVGGGMGDPLGARK